MSTGRSSLPRPLATGDVLPALQLATEHGHETGWEAVRLSRPNARPCTGARLPKREQDWRSIVVLSRITDGPGGLRLTEWSVQPETLMLVRRGSDLGRFGQVGEP